MINPKNICISACIGFCLSFFIGLLSDVRISHVLLRAFLFALLFAALCIGVTFLYQKFLANADANSFGEPEPASSRNPAATNGSVINIVVDDSSLPDDGMAPKFNVAQNHTGPISGSAVQAPGNPEPVNAAPSDVARPEAPKAEDNSFKPMGLESVASPAAGPVAESEPQSFAASPSAGAETAEAAPEKLDELPDMGTLDAIASESDEEGMEFAGDSSAEVIDDTEFATGGKHLKEQPVSGDTNVMAKAIQTLLAKDNS